MARIKRHRIGFEYLEYDGLDSLPETYAALMGMAIGAREKAYAPYSGFAVGAAVLLGNGEVVTGNNQENAAYPSGLCAERVAIYHAGSVFPGVEIKALAVYAGPKSGPGVGPIAPCGSCRQSILEYENLQHGPITVLMMGTSGAIVQCPSIGDLLPLGFVSDFLS